VHRLAAATRPQLLEQRGAASATATEDDGDSRGGCVEGAPNATLEPAICNHHLLYPRTAACDSRYLATNRTRASRDETRRVIFKHAAMNVN
jgi:hypothetical protein